MPILVIGLFYFVLIHSAHHKRTAIDPGNFPNSVWESTNPEIYLQVGSETEGGIRGYLVKDGEAVEIRFHTEWGTYGEILENTFCGGADWIGENKLTGKLKCTETEVLIKVKRDDFFENAYKTITLTRTS